MSLSPTEVLRHLQLRLGASHRQLELGPEELMQVVFQETLPTFSKLWPHYIRLRVTDNDLVPDYGQSQVYFIRTDAEILGISKVWVDHVDHRGKRTAAHWGNDPWTRQIYADLMSAVETPITFQWIPPDKIELFPKDMAFGPFLIEVKTVHPKHLATVPYNLRDQFLRLALLDVRIALYHIRNRFQSFNTNFGSIELPIDELREAENERLQLLEEWRTQAARHPMRKKMWVY